MRLNSTYFVVIEVLDERELHKIAINHLSDIEFKYFVKFFENVHCKTIFFSVNDIFFASENILLFKSNLLEII